MMEKTFIIAEAGVNHNGSLERAMQMVDVAAEVGADAIKFQTFKAEKVISRNAPKAEYQKAVDGTGETQLEMLKKLELDEAAHKKIFAHSQQRAIHFLSTPFDLDSIDLLIALGLQTWKIPSGEITNLPYLRKIGGLKQEIILSTGMADLEEIEDALDVLTEAGTTLEKITVLHCNTEYPTPYEDVHLRAMVTIRDAFPGVSVGYSDHTLGIEIAIAAVALGATVIEKHFTLDRNMDGPDHRASLESSELKAMVKSIRNIELAMGDGIKRPSSSELKNRAIVRKSIVASRPIQAGELFTEENISIKRPGSGISPMLWDTIIGRRATRDYTEDEIVEA